MIDKLIKDILKKIILVINKEDNKNIIQNEILYPIFYQLKLKLYPFIIFIILLNLINLILIIILLYNKKKSNLM
jgi:hypothetical protein